MLGKKGIAALIIGKPAKSEAQDVKEIEHEEAEGMDMEAAKLAADKLITALKRGDSEGVVKAFCMLRDLSIDHEYAESEEDGEY